MNHEAVKRAREALLMEPLLTRKAWEEKYAKNGDEADLICMLFCELED